MGKNKTARGMGLNIPTPGYVNARTYWDYFYKLKEYAINMFEWTGLPDTIDSRYIELMLFDIGYVCFFKDDITGSRVNLPNIENKDTYLCLQCTLGGRFNVYNLPTQYHVYTASGYRAERDKSNAVIIYNNYLHQPTYLSIEMFAYRLYNIERTIDICLNNLKHPVMITASENQVLTIKNLWNKVSENEPLIIGDSNIDLSQIQAIVTGVKNETIDLNALKHQIMNEALTFLGINNANTDKKERMITSEVTSNNEQLLCSRDIMLNARKQACEEINKMFGLNIDVRFRNEDVEVKEQDENNKENKEGE